MSATVMETTDVNPAEAGLAEVFSLNAILDPSEALAAADRLYARQRSGLRFFCENRRVVSVQEAEALGSDADLETATETLEDSRE